MVKRPKRPSKRRDAKSLIAELETKAKERATATAQALLQSDAADSLAAYLQRGRAFQNMGNAELQSRWAHAFRLWVIEKTLQRQLTMDDFMAELGLRNLQPDLTPVQKEYDMLLAVIKREYEQNPSPPELIKKIDEYMRKSRDEAN